jgi:hypothetical protein
MSRAYNWLLLLHVLAVVAGYGPVSYNTLYASRARRLGEPAASAAMRVNRDVTAVAQVFVYAIPTLGLLTLWASDGAFSLRDTWIWLTLVLFVASRVVVHAVVHPTTRRVNALRDAPAPAASVSIDTTQTVAMLIRNLGALSAVLNLNTVVMIALMLWKPAL